MMTPLQKISAEEFAKELFAAPLNEELKQRVLSALPHMSSGKIERIYDILKNTRQRREQDLLKLDVNCSEELAKLKNNFAGISN